MSDTPVQDPPAISSSVPTSWRDVYQLVQDAEKRLTVRIEDGFSSQGIVAADHEVRIRTLETSSTQDDARSTIMRTFVLALMSIGSMVIAVLAIVLK